MPRRRTEALAGEVVSTLLGRADAVRRGFQELLAPHGITLQQYNVLRILRGNGGPGLPTLAVADRMMEKSPGITRLLDRLEAKGLIRRERADDDRRLVRAVITPRGTRLVGKLDRPMDTADERVVSGLSRKDQRALVTLLDALA